MTASNKKFLSSFSINRLIAYIVAGGFIFLLIETRIEHHEVMNEKLVACVPMIVSAVGVLLASLAAFLWKPKLIRVLHFYLILTMLVGLGGMFFHNEDRFEAKHQEETELRDDASHEHDAQQHEEHPPMLAPFAFVGLGVVGLLGTSRRWNAEVA